ncbi:PC4/YdbC family ssDNA-binding protein [Mycoplasmopsis ciconiae]|uniref:PC4/YdbC family ssDNA-binding protein n=1 Tax=Mycoplasmopsis ciconiae TaxID=561067 RepID=A0ABU7MM04_9BACT|nr:PC4/YdbC family ssDNA-binding protein [Mycoplasmopsis ciconiae]
MEKNTKIEFKIVKHIAVINKLFNGWTRELNMVSWNNNEAKLDLRDWDESHTKMSKGFTFTKEEAQNLIEALKNEIN